MFVVCSLAVVRDGAFRCAIIPNQSFDVYAFSLTGRIHSTGREDVFDDHMIEYKKMA